jgi:hypothetical protein
MALNNQKHLGIRYLHFEKNHNSSFGKNIVVLPGLIFEKLLNTEMSSISNSFFLKKS